MQKLRFFLIFFLLPAMLFAQQRSKIILRRSSLAVVDTKTNITYVKNPVFVHDNAIMTCDSANFYQDRNFFEAFRNVHIVQSDTINVYSDFLNYDGNTKKAHLTDRVILQDNTSKLTTNILDYDLNTKIGTYVNGGKIENASVTVVSKNGYYFAGKKDAFFRYNVVATTPQTTIKSDTLRYNTFTNWTYFYGPTNIKGKDDNLYTENGAYNTQTENAMFGKKNLYTQGSRSLKGDSLYYYGKTGYGKAVKNIIFKDTKDNMSLYGQLGEYYKESERVIVTKNAWFALGTKDSVMMKGKKIPDTTYLGADTLESQMALLKNIKLLNKPVIKKDNELGVEDEEQKKLKEKEKAEARRELTKADNYEEVSPSPAKEKKLSKKQQKLADLAAEEAKKNPPKPPLIDSAKIILLEKLKRDSIIMDSLKTDSLKKLSPKTLNPGVVANAKKLAKPNTTKSVVAKDSLTAKLNPKKDSIAVFNPADTVRARVIKAYHSVRVFKSNMQAKADSLFYSSADSVLRWYKNPILWAEGSQQTGDTIHVFFKNSKINSFQAYQNGFIVNVETDSTKFNQVKGKYITGFFNNEGNLRDIYVDGNAESMYYNKNNKGEYDNLSQTVSSRIKFRFFNKELTDILTIKGNDGVVYPIDSLPKETTLTGFIWKPELRPTSKADIIKGKTIKKATSKPAVKVATKLRSTASKSKAITPVKNGPATTTQKSGAAITIEKKPSDSLKVKPPEKGVN